MLLVLSITFYFHYNTWGWMCSTGPFKYRWLKGYVYSSCYYHNQIGSIHLSHCYYIFPLLCCFGLQIVFICLYITPSHYHHCANFIWRHWTYKMPVRYNLSSVWVRFTYSLSYPLYNMWDCVFSVYPFPLGWLREYIYVVLWSSSNREYELLPIV